MTRTSVSKTSGCLILFAATLLAGGRAFAFNLAQTPLFLTGSVNPNVVYMLDDSGSMQFEVMPGEIMDEFGYRDDMRYLFPTPDGTYGGDMYPSAPIPGTSKNSDEGAFYRSRHNNKLFYDPSVNYRPWFKADGSRYPDADPQAAYYNPARTGAGSLDLTNTDGCGWDWRCDAKYWAVYYKYKGSGDVTEANNYDHVKIVQENAPFDGGPGRTDCQDSAGGKNQCTYQEEIQNFANWFSYYRSRFLTAVAGSGEAFSRQGNKIRVGYGVINARNLEVDGQNSNQGMVAGVRTFQGTARQDFFDRLYNTDVLYNVGTPLRRALQGAGEYYERTDDRGPWNSTPGQAGGDDYECRSSYTVLMTDGYWSGNNPGVGNSDNHAGSRINNPDPDGNDYTYSPVEPFADNENGTLADVAMEYWKRDLRSDMDNEVPHGAPNVAFWQHMVTFGVGLGVEGTVNPDDAFDAIENNDTIDWPDPDNGGSAKVDDLLHASVNGRGGFFSAQDPEKFAERLSDMLKALIESTVGSASSVAANSTRLETDTLVFQGRFDSGDWSGDLRAYRLNDKGTITGTSWRAAEKLDNRNLASNPRAIYTWDDSSNTGVAFQWNKLTNAQKQALRDGDSAALGQQRLAYIRGQQDNETDNGGTLRSRESIMGDIINSRPIYTKDERYGYRSFTTDVGQKYIEFIQSMQNPSDPQPGMVYVGGNDGMLHAFDARTGEEVFSYVPSGIYGKLADLTRPQYQHKYFVDGSPTIGDVYFGGKWHRILIGTMGAGGSTVFALDITNPKSFSKEDILWEFTHSELGAGVEEVSLVRVEVSDKKDQDPEYRWDVIFGDGYGTEGNSQLFVLDAATGTMRGGAPISAGGGSSSSPNGMATPFVADTNGDRSADLVYAGDLRGNVWRFGLDSNKQWQLEYRLFTAENESGVRQPITSKVRLAFNEQDQKMILFGTGKYMEVGDNDPDSSTAQALYGLIDTGNTLTRSDLVRQTLQSQFTRDDRELRRATANEFDPEKDQGWYVSLDPDSGAPREGERSVVQPLITGGTVIFVSIVPSDNPCDSGGTSWLTAVDLDTGQRLGSAFFDITGDGLITKKDQINNNDGSVTSPGGLKTNAGIIDTPTELHGDKKNKLIYSGSDSDPLKGGGGTGPGDECKGESSDCTVGGKSGPQSWRQLR